MSSRTGAYGSDGVAERRAQRVLNEKVGDRLLPRRKWQRSKWTRSFRTRRTEQTEA